MVLTLKVKKAKGQQAIDWLRKKGWLNTEHKLGKTMMYLIIPLSKSANSAEAKKQFSGMIEEKNMQKQKRSEGSLVNKLSKILRPELLEKVQSSFDMVGNIAILDIPEELEKQEKSIAWTLLKSVPGIKTVAKRFTLTEGEFRIRKIKTLVGNNTSETLHRENGVSLLLDINKAYFSPRLASERLRIAKKVKKGEKVLVLFAGIGPYTLVINKIQPKVKKIVSVEINPDAVKYLKENIKLNCNIYNKGKLPAIAQMIEKHEAILGDAKKVLPKLKDKFDRVAMPLPHSAIDFLADTIKVTKKGGIIHLYVFDDKDKPEATWKKMKKYPVKVIDVTTCGAYSPKLNRYCFDLQVK